MESIKDLFARFMILYDDLYFFKYRAIKNAIDLFNWNCLFFTLSLSPFVFLWLLVHIKGPNGSQAKDETISMVDTVGGPLNQTISMVHKLTTFCFLGGLEFFNWIQSLNSVKSTQYKP